MTTKLKITQIRSRIGSQKKHKRTLDALGISRHQSTVYRNDNPAVRGMLNKISHLVSWEEVNEKDIPEETETPRGISVVSGGKKAGKKAEKSKKE